MKLPAYLILLVAFWGMSCTDLEPVEVEAYYDVDSLVNAQYEALKFSDYSIRKRSMVNGEVDTSLIQPADTSKWLYELNVFRKANINKPVLRGAYQVEREKTNDGHSITYVPLEPEKRSVRFLRVVYQQDNLREVHARIKETNPVYGSERELGMYFGGSEESSRLLRYEVSGKQKMFLKDTVTLRVSSEILYDSK